MTKIVEAEPAGLVPRHVVHGLRLGGKPLGVLVPVAIGPLRLPFPPADLDDGAEHPGPHE